MMMVIISVDISIIYFVNISVVILEKMIFNHTVEHP